MVLVYGLAALDHHAAERIPGHMHLVASGAPIPPHVHGFEVLHDHTHDGAARVAGDQFPSLTNATPVTLSQTWLGDLSVVPADRFGLVLVFSGVYLGGLLVLNRFRPAVLLRPPTEASAGF
jgi:hypothetical protein